MSFNDIDGSYLGSFKNNLMSNVEEKDLIIGNSGGYFECGDEFVEERNINSVKREKTLVLNGYAGLLQEKMDPFGPYQVQKNVHLLIEKWGKVFPIPPDQFLLKLVHSRGFKNRYLDYTETSLKKRYQYCN